MMANTGPYLNSAFPLRFGEDRGLLVSVFDANGNAVNVTGFALSFKLYDPSDNLVLTKTTSSGITFPGGSYPTNDLLVTILATDTSGWVLPRNQDSANYYYVVGRTDANFVTDIAEGTITFHAPKM
jgi:hypothetical protein